MAQQAALDVRLKRSHDNLQAARETATQARGYTSATTREALRKAFTDRFGSAPHEWQVDVTEALLLGLDSVVIAGTGAGKTMPFMMPLLHDKTKIVVIISPLNILEKDMAARFKKMGIAAVPVNKQTWNERLHQELKDLKWRAILLSPEMGLENPAIRELLGSKAYAERITAFIIDECHCISQWGGEFRPKYSLVEKFRAFVPTHIPFLATSATLPSAALTETCMKLNIDLQKSFFLNLGNDRPNLTPTVIRIKSTNDYTELKRLITTGVISPEDLEQTVVYIDSVTSTQHLVREIRSWFPNDFHDAIDCLSSRRTEFAKGDVMERFSKGVVKILVATEAAGMGADIPNIKRVIQFGLCKSLSIWTQRAGRAGRSPGVHASVYLLVEESMFHRRKRKKGEAGDDVTYIVNAEDEGVWARKVEEPFRRWIQAPGCRRDVSDEYFDSPRPRKRELVYRKKRDEYSPSSFATSAILPDPILTALATKTSLKTVDDLLALKTPWIFAEQHGAEVLEVIRRVDVARKAALDQAKAEKSAKKKLATADRKEKEREQRLVASARKREERAAMRDAARAPAPSTLVGSFSFNMGPSTPVAQQVRD
ncbi:hypothetical protein PLICRDRAFT_106921 [Plicaturopsis crispa FD-325 SS-3]|nr:hypothetical protein PLICRDRAFT_106921 [Plicaturopsis crispa FD-325 SS-3]